MNQYSLFALVAQWPNGGIVTYKCIEKVTAPSIEEVCIKLGVIIRYHMNDSWRVEPDFSEKGVSLKKEMEKMEVKKEVKLARFRLSQFLITLDKEL
ncbi:MAG: hypothetical protein HYT20_01975 [Candidatus Nealsonbacteria bacterium]|nr:hypothetical protein [Candidatus Nealsonbacteria bacterium]